MLLSASQHGSLCPPHPGRMASLQPPVGGRQESCYLQWQELSVDSFTSLQGDLYSLGLWAAAAVYQLVVPTNHFLILLAGCSHTITHVYRICNRIILKTVTWGRKTENLVCCSSA